MAATREIRRRIASVRKVAQMTRAVQLVASSKMRRAQEHMLASRPYATQLVQFLARLATQAERQEDLPLLRERAVRRVGIILMTPDRGKAGALSANTNRYAAQLVLDLRRKYDDPKLPIGFIAIGRQGRDFLVRTRQRIIAEFTDLGDVPTREDVRAIVSAVTSSYMDEEMDRVFLVYPQFVSAMVQTPTGVRVLPVREHESVDKGLVLQTSHYLFEPDATTLFAELLLRYVESQIYQPLLETVTSFYAAQTIAMRHATDNATELLDDLTLTYNKARQTAITMQILEIVAGSGAH